MCLARTASDSDSRVQVAKARSADHSWHLEGEILLRPLLGQKEEHLRQSANSRPTGGPTRSGLLIG